MWRRQLPYVIMMLFGVIGLINSLALYNFWYWNYRWLDMPMHFLGGVTIALLALWLVLVRGRDKERLGVASHKKLILLSVISVLVIGISWELFEFNTDVLIVFAEKFMWSDTFSDIFFDVLGSLLAFVWFKKHYYSVEESLIKID